MQVRTEAAVKLQEAFHQERGQKEWYRQSQRVDGQQQDSFHQGCLFAGDIKNGGEDWAETWSPAESESEADDEGAKGRAAALHAVQACVGVQGLDFEDPRQVQAENDNDHAGHNR